MSGCARRHTGLGFSEPETAVPVASETASEASTDVAECTDVDGDSGAPAITADKTSEEEKKQDESLDNGGSGGSLGSKKSKMTGFVESASS